MAIKLTLCTLAVYYIFQCYLLSVYTVLSVSNVCTVLLICLLQCYSYRRSRMCISCYVQWSQLLIIFCSILFSDHLYGEEWL